MSSGSPADPEMHDRSVTFAIKRRPDNGCSLSRGGYHRSSFSPIVSHPKEPRVRRGVRFFENPWTVASPSRHAS